MSQNSCKGCNLLCKIMCILWHGITIHSHFGTMIKYEINEMPYAKKHDFKLVFWAKKNIYIYIKRWLADLW